MSAFDPYSTWLGIPPAEQPPNHYRLLGVPLYESDMGAIGHAADCRVERIQVWLGSPQEAAARQVLGELRTARLCLFDPEHRAEYDAALRRGLVPGEQPATQFSVGMEGALHGSVVRPLPRSTWRMGSGTSPPSLGSPLPFSAVSPPPFPPPTALLSPQSPAPFAAEVLPPPSASATHSIEPIAGEAPAENESAGMSVGARLRVRQVRGKDALYLVALAGTFITLLAIAALWFALGGRQDKLVKRVQEAEKPVHVGTPVRAIDLELPVDSDLAQEGMSESDHESPEADDADGESLPTEAAHSLPPTSTEKATKAKGSGKGNKRKASGPKKAAKKPGEMKLRAPPVAQSRSAPEAAGEIEPAEMPVKSKIINSTPTDLVPSTLPAAKAATPETTSSPDNAPVIDALKAKMESLVGLSRSARSPADKEEVVASALELVEQALEAKRIKDAQEMAELADRVEYTMPNHGKRTVEAKIKVRLAKNLDDARQTLERDLGNPAANLIVGKHLCLEEGDFAKGLVHLVKSDDAKLKEAATLDLARPDSLAAQMSVAQAWTEAAAKGDKRFLARAAAWYRHALQTLPNLSPLDAKRLNAKLGSLEIDRNPAIQQLVALPGVSRIGP